VSRDVPTRLWAWSALGLAGALLTAVAAPRALADGVVGWWSEPALPGGHGLAVALVWVGMGALAIAWLAVALGSRPAQLTPRRAALVGLCWAIPLALAPPLFSRDVYSYLAQGTILHLGHDPYDQAPAVLAALHRGHTLAAVSPFWRHTTAPYGPLFLALVSLIVGISGSHLVVGVLLCRVLDLAGLWLLIAHVPRVARALGADEGRSVWLAAASPLVLLGLLAPAHNDLLMAGLVAAGLAYALRGNPLLGVAVCALAATIKLPALAGAVFIAVCWARAEPDRATRRRLLGAAIVITVAVLAAVTVAAGVGLGWVSTSVFSTPAKVRLAVTPATAFGYTIAGLLHDAGVAVSARGLESAIGVAAAAVAAGVGLGLLARARVPTLAARLGATLVLAAVAGPATWPWYLSWGLVLLCACPRPQRSRALLAALALGAFLVRPDGTLVLPLGSAPGVLAAEVALAVAAWVRWRRSRTGRAAPGIGSAGPSEQPPVASTLVRT
jgi:hypothetical protein